MSCKKLELFQTAENCAFCGTNVYDELQFGSVYKYKHIITHYYCLLLSSNAEQNGKDNEGIFGFLLLDIEKELKRGKRLRCFICKKLGATLTCSVSKCKLSFHLPCGIRMGTLHQFYGQFKSYCNKHRPRQSISRSVMEHAQTEPTTCVICYESLVVNDETVLWAPCCKKNALFHRICIQKLANSFGGYAFRCPLCNDQQLFSKAMKDFGIYVPERDASWEQEDNAFQELLFRHSECNNKKCICPYGRKYNKKTSHWRIILCYLCGSQGIHYGCNTCKSSNWQCDTCISILNAGNGSTDSEEARLTYENSRVSEPSSSRMDRSSSMDSSRKIIANAETCRKLKKVQLSESNSSLVSTSSEFSVKSRNANRNEITKPLRKLPPNRARSHSSSSTNSRHSSRSRSKSSSPSIISVTRSISPVIIIDSDDSSDDVEVVADVTNSVLINREGTKIQVVQFTTEENLDVVEVKGDISVKNIELNCGIKMVNSLVPVKSEYISKKRKPLDYEDMSNTFTKVYKTNTLNTNSAFKRGHVPSATVTSATHNDNVGSLSPEYTSVKLSNNVNIPAGRMENNIFNITHSNHILNAEGYQNCRLAPSTVVDVNDNIKYSVKNKSVNQICQQPSINVLHQLTTESPNDVFSKVPSHTTIKIVETPTNDKNQMGKPMDWSTIRYISNSPKSRSLLQSAINNRNAIQQVKSNHCILDECTRTSPRNEKSREKRVHSEPVYDNIRLKELRVVLSPLMFKRTKEGAIKVVQKRLLNNEKCILLRTPQIPSLSAVVRSNKNGSSGFIQSVLKRVNHTYNSIFKAIDAFRRSRIEDKGATRTSYHSVKSSDTMNSTVKENHYITQKRRRNAVTFCSTRKTRKERVKIIKGRKCLPLSSTVFYNVKSQITIDKMFDILKPSNNANELKFLPTSNTAEVKKLKQPTLFDVFNNKSENINSCMKRKQEETDLQPTKRMRIESERNLVTIPLNCCISVNALFGKVEGDAYFQRSGLTTPDTTTVSIFENKDEISHETGSVQITKDFEVLKRNCENNTVLYEYKTFKRFRNGSDTELLVTLDFPCDELHLFRDPSCVQFTTVPLAKRLANNVILSTVKMEVKKYASPNKNNCYEFIVSYGDLNIVMIRVHLKSSDRSCSKESNVKDYPVNYMCLNNVIKLNTCENSPDKYRNGITLDSSNYEKRVCFTFDNERYTCNRISKKKSAYFALPSALYFNSVKVIDSKICLQLLLKIIRNFKRIDKPKCCTFKSNNTDSLVHNIQPSCVPDESKLIDKQSNSIASCLAADSSKPDTLQVVHKQSKVLDEIQNKLNRT